MNSNEQPRLHARAERPSPRPLSLGLVGGFASLAVLVIAVSVISAQAWVLRGDARDRQTRESGPSALSPSPASYSASAQSRQALIAGAGLVPWPTTQPAAPLVAPVASTVLGLNHAKVKAGNAAFQRLGCIACHSADGHAGIGPSLYNAFGSQVQLEGGGSIKVDADYIRESIKHPKAKIHKGFQPVMPEFGPQIKDREIETIMEFLKSISPDPASRKETGPKS